MSNKTPLNWDDIKSEFNNGILFIGNGASIAIDDKFDYKKIRTKGTELGKIKPHLNTLFEHLDTENFEIILEYLYKAAKINEVLDLDSEKPKQYYKELREGLIDTLLEIHPQYNKIQTELNEINNFISQFQVIIDLNYDLIMYWALMKEEEKFNDFFGKGGDINFGNINEVNSIERIIIYPHGNLALCKSVESNEIIESHQKVYAEQELKVKGGEEDDSYNNILTLIRNYNFLEPLFVSEGTSDQKTEAIKSSQYLRKIFFEILPSLKFRKKTKKSFNEAMTLLGFSFGPNDEHIFKQLAEGTQTQQDCFKLKNVAVSIYNQDSKVIERATEVLKKYNLVDEKKIKFFEVKSCEWPQNN